MTPDHFTDPEKEELVKLSREEFQKLDEELEPLLVQYQLIQKTMPGALEISREELGKH